jgi:diacylglycerol kinase (ATP)
MKKVFLINPISGGKAAGSRREKIKELAGREEESTIRISGKPGEIEKEARRLAEAGFEGVIYVSGGDGTVQEAVSGVIRTPSGLCILPNGSGDGFATNAGYRKKEWKKHIQGQKVQLRLVDAYQINQRTGMNMCGFGFDAHIAHLFAINKGRGLGGYVKLIAKSLFKSSEKQFSIVIDGEKSIQISAWILGIANGAIMGNGAVVNPGGKIDDGFLELYAIKKPKWHQIPMAVIQLFSGNLHRSSLHFTEKGKHFLIESEDGIAHIDGEPYHCESNVFTVDVCESSIRLIYPE